MNLFMTNYFNPTENISKIVIRNKILRLKPYFDWGFALCISRLFTFYPNFSSFRTKRGLRSIFFLYIFFPKQYRFGQGQSLVYGRARGGAFIIFSSLSGSYQTIPYFSRTIDDIWYLKHESFIFN